MYFSKTPAHNTSYTKPQYNISNKTRPATNIGAYVHKNFIQARCSVVLIELLTISDTNTKIIAKIIVTTA